MIVARSDFEMQDAGRRTHHGDAEALRRQGVLGVGEERRAMRDAGQGDAGCRIQDAGFRIQDAGGTV